MTDNATIKLVIAGIIVLGGISLGLYAWKADPALIAAGSAAIGALSSMLARTSTGPKQ